MTVFLIVFASIYCPLVQFPKQACTCVHSISFVAHFQYFLHPHLRWTRQTFEAYGKLVQTEYPEPVACQAHAQTWTRIINQTLTPFRGLKSWSPNMLFQILLRWWYIFYGSSSFSKQNSNNIDLACVDSRNVHAYNKLIQCQKINSNICEGELLMEDSFAKVGVISGQFSQVLKNDFLSFPQDEDGISKPLKPWKTIIQHIHVLWKFCWFRGRE